MKKESNPPPPDGAVKPPPPPAPPLTEGKIKGEMSPKRMAHNVERPNSPPPSGRVGESYVPTNELPPPPLDNFKMSERERQWREFSEAVAMHLRNYTVPQYGDVGEDEITHYSVKDCVTHLQRYAKRFGSQSRQGQQHLDFMKIAHYAQCAWEKYDDMDNPNVSLVDMGYDMFLSYSEEENNNLAANGFKMIGTSLDANGREVTGWIRKENI